MKPEQKAIDKLSVMNIDRKMENPVNDTTPHDGKAENGKVETAIEFYKRIQAYRMKSRNQVK